MLPPRERLRSNRQFRQVFARGQSFADPLVVLHVLRTPENPADRQAGFTASKKLGNAVVRNRTKRRLREGYRHLLPGLDLGYWAVFVARTRAASESAAALEGAMQGVLSRAGLWRPPVDPSLPGG